MELAPCLTADSVRMVPTDLDALEFAVDGGSCPGGCREFFLVLPSSSADPAMLPSRRAADGHHASLSNGHVTTGAFNFDVAEGERHVRASPGYGFGFEAGV